jgi:hypothetical protein
MVQHILSEQTDGSVVVKRDRKGVSVAMAKLHLFFSGVWKL